VKPPYELGVAVGNEARVKLGIRELVVKTEVQVNRGDRC
jgi:hypothetical protein